MITVTLIQPQISPLAREVFSHKTYNVLALRAALRSLYIFTITAVLEKETGCYMGSRSAALLSCSISPDVAGLSNLQSSEVVLHRHLALCKGDFGCESSADCTWNQLSNYFSASLILHRLLTKDVLHLSTLFADRFAIFACYRRKGHFQQTGVCTAVSSFSSSICMEVLTTAGADGTDPSARAAAFALRQAPTILPLGLGRLNSLDLCSWPQNSAQLLGYMYLDGGMSLL